MDTHERRRACLMFAMPASSTVRTVIDAVLSKQHAPVEKDGIVHLLWGYTHDRERWAFFCGITYEGDGHVDEVSKEPITCLLCKGLSTRNAEALKTPW
jgi:hypothetical protein